MFIWWCGIGLVISIYILVIKGNKGRTKGAETRKRVKEAFQNNALYYLIMAPSFVFWTLTFAVIWPLLIYVEYFFKKDEE